MSVPTRVRPVSASVHPSHRYTGQISGCQTCRVGCGVGKGVRGLKGTCFWLQSKSWHVAHSVMMTGNCCVACLKGTKEWKVLMLNSTLKKKNLS